MKTLMKVLTLFAPATPDGHFDRYMLWARPKRYILPNLILAMIWGPLWWEIQTPLFYHDLLFALLWLSLTLSVGPVVILVLRRYGIGPDRFDIRPYKPPEA